MFSVVIVHETLCCYLWTCWVPPVLIPTLYSPWLGCEPTVDQDVIYVEVDEGDLEAQASKKEEEGVDYYAQYQEGSDEE